jgi:hypothetical protein
MATAAARRENGDLAGDRVDQQVLRLARQMDAGAAFVRLDQVDLEGARQVARVGGDALEDGQAARAHADDGDAGMFHSDRLTIS